MKRIFILVVVTMLAVGSMFADEQTLIDFSKLGLTDAKGTANPDAIAVADREGDEAPETPNHNKRTLMDFSNGATGTYTARQKLAMKSSLAIENWDVVFASSAQNVTNKHLSYTRTTASNAFEQVMGVRVHFPTESFNSWAKVVPPFSIPAFEGTTVSDDGTIEASEDSNAGVTTLSRFETSQKRADTENASGVYTEPAYGIIKNVGAIKSIAVNVYGLNFPHSLSVILIDDQDVEHTYFMGYLNFEGWGELRWDNPQYVQNVRNRDINVKPIYPDNTPYVKFGGFLIQRQANHKGGDFVTYFKDVKLIYDQAVLETERDIDDEATWSIVRDRDSSRNTNELQRLGKVQMERKFDLDRQAKEPTPEDKQAGLTFKRTPGNDDE
ncbi:MAG: flagellar filament outer layer protein FlaA [Spirochaetaceae bacterium]|jgi:hypothetical protein|nr:flagellar filament outer layer protein FlaA [Spirochaetaceae bacterium]